MSWFAKLAGELAGAFFPGSTAVVERLVNRAVDVAKAAAKRFLESIQESNVGTRSAKNAYSQAEELAEEERYLAEKVKCDGRWSSADLDRTKEIFAERQKLREELDEVLAKSAAEEIAAANGLVDKPLSSHEMAGLVGLLSTKACVCGGAMHLQIGRYSVSAGGQSFYWACTAARKTPCARVYLTPKELQQQTTVRAPNIDLDLPDRERQDAMRTGNLLAETHGRLRSHLDDVDKAIFCPDHILPMRLLQRSGSKGLMLDSYHYVCRGVHTDGRACDYTVPVVSTGQVSAILQRTEGRGIH